MKLAITTSGQDLDSQVDSRFGRAQGFIIYDLETQEFEYVNNEQNLNAAQGAGIQAAQNVVDQGVDALVTGHCGPKAYRVLSEAKVKIFVGSQGTIKETIEMYNSNKLQEANDADVEGHWV